MCWRSPNRRDRQHRRSVTTLQDALERAKKNDAHFWSIVAELETAREDRVQAKLRCCRRSAESRPSISARRASIVPSGRFVTNDGVHVFRAGRSCVRRFRRTSCTRHRTGGRRPARRWPGARLEIAQRGLAVTVTQRYYALVTGRTALRDARNRQRQHAQRFFDIAQRQQNVLAKSLAAMSSRPRSDLPAAAAELSGSAARDGERKAEPRGAAVSDAERELHGRGRSQLPRRDCRRFQRRG